MTITLTEKDQLPPYKGYETELLIEQLLELSHNSNRDFPDDSFIVCTAISKIRELESEISELDIILSEIEHELDDVIYAGGYYLGIRKLKNELALKQSRSKGLIKWKFDRVDYYKNSFGWFKVDRNFFYSGNQAQFTWGRFAFVFEKKKWINA